MHRKFKIAGVGEVLWDIYPDKKYLGGAVSNSIFHINRLSHEGILISKVGKDKYGEELIEELEKNGVATDFVQVDPVKPTGTVEVRLDEKAVPSFKCTSGTAYEYLDWDEKFSDLIASLDGLIFGTLVQINPHSRKTLYKLIEQLKNTLIVYDINLRGWPGESNELIEKSLQFTDILKLNFDEFDKLKEKLGIRKNEVTAILQVLLRRYDIKLISLSMGAQGGLFIDKNRIIYVPGIIVNPIDTTGAGDAFVSAIVVKYLEGASIEEIGEFSNYLGAFITIMRGATPDYNLQDIDHFKALHKKRRYHPEFSQYTIKE